MMPTEVLSLVRPESEFDSRPVSGVYDPYPQESAIDQGGVSGPQAFLNAGERDGVTAANGKISYSIDVAGNQIIRGDAGWGGIMGHAFTVTYAYRADAPATMPDDAGGFTPFGQAQIDQAELALKAWSDVANIHFVRVGSGDVGPQAYSDSASILLGNYSTGVAGAAAFGNFPGSTSAGSAAGDVWVNSTFGYNQTPTTGNYGGQVLVHELGHAIGLAHPSDYNAGANVTITYATDASYYEDSRQYTVMSYFSESNTGANYGGVYSAAPLLDDIKAAQLEYGANMATRTGADTYGFNSTTGEAWNTATSASSKLVFAVWDAGGNDTFDFSGFSQSQVIDLHAGDFSNVGGLTGNVAIAEGVTIENAIGGSGNDKILGNDAGNRIFGHAGADSIIGGAGTNYLRGDDGNDSIVGGTGFNDINGNLGDDTVEGHSQIGDWLVGGQGNDLIYSRTGSNILYGNIGNDTLTGGGGAEILRGGQGDDSITAGDGNGEWLSGDRGDDTLVGGAGADTFHTFGDAGIDRVLHFDVTKDHVQLDPGTQYTLSQVGADTVISMTGGGQMTLVGVQLSALPQGWIFGA